LSRIQRDTSLQNNGVYLDT